MQESRSSSDNYRAPQEERNYRQPGTASCRTPYERLSTKSLSASVTGAVMVVRSTAAITLSRWCRLSGIMQCSCCVSSAAACSTKASRDIPPCFPSSTGPGSHCHRHNLSISSRMASISCWAVLSRPSSADFPSMAEGRDSLCVLGEYQCP